MRRTLQEERRDEVGVKRKEKEKGKDEEKEKSKSGKTREKRMRRKVAHFHRFRLQRVSYQGCLTPALPSTLSSLPQLENPLFSYSFTKAKQKLWKDWR